MTRSTTGIAHRRRLAAAALAVTALAFVTGCSSGRITQTDTTVAAIPGTDLEMEVPGGRIMVRNAHVAYPGTQGYPSGASVPLDVRIFNDTKEPVRLVGATSPAGRVVLARDGGPSPSPTAPAQTESSINIEIPAWGFVVLAPNHGQHLQIADLAQALLPGNSVTLTLQFSNGTTISDVRLPMNTPVTPVPRSPLPIEHGPEGGAPGGVGN